MLTLLFSTIVTSSFDFYNDLILIIISYVYLLYIYTCYNIYTYYFCIKYIYTIS